MRNIRNFVASSPVPSQVLNHEGAPAFMRDLREQTVQVLNTGSLGNTFYAKGRDLGTEAVEVLTKMREEDPVFLAQALVDARERGLMKSLPVLGLVVLSAGQGRTRRLFDAIFDRVVRIPDDLRAFATLCLAGTIPGRAGLGGMANKAAKRWMVNMSEFHAVKYGSAASREVTLRDLLRLTHPVPSTPEIAERFGWLVKGKDGLTADTALNPQIRALEALKSAATEEEQITLIREGRLPFEVVVPSLKATNTAVWASLLPHAPFFNLLRNLVTFNRHGVFADEANVALAVQRLTDPEAIAKSRVLPFRFFDAYRAWIEKAEAQDSRIADALRTALNLSFANLPDFGGRTVAIGTDVSGSMSSGSISDLGTTRFIDIAGIFTGALLRSIGERTIALPFQDRTITNHGLSPRDDVLSTAEKVSRLGGGGTAIGAPVQTLLERKHKVDVFIGITDNEDWAYGVGHTCEGRFIDLWRHYRKEIAPNAQAFLITIAPYREVLAPGGEPGVHFIYGWSDSVLQYIGLNLEAGASQVSRIASMNLGIEGTDTAAVGGTA